MKDIQTLRVKKLPHFSDLPEPEYALESDSGFDLRVACAGDDPVEFHPGDRALIPTGLAFGIPEGYELQVRPRSGLAIRHGVGIVNAPGTVDAGFTGEVMVILENRGSDSIVLLRGDRIAQAVLAPIARARFEYVDELDATERGDGGFGHTGTD